MIPIFRPMMVRQRHPRLNDYLSRFTALGGTMSGDQINALQTLFNGLWIDGLITGNLAVSSSDLLQYFNIFAAPVGSTIAQIQEPQCRPTGATGTNNGFVSGDLTSAGMISSGTKRYDAGFAPASVMSTTSAHISIHINSATSVAATRVVGCTNTYIYYEVSGGSYIGGAFHDDTNQIFQSRSLTAPFFFVGGRTGSTQELTINGTTVTQSANSTAPSSSVNLCFGNTSNGTKPVTDRYTFESCGYYLNSTQKANLRTRVLAFNTAIGR